MIVCLHQNRELHILQSHPILGNGLHFIFVCPQIHHIALVTKVVHWMQLRQFFGKIPRITAAVSVARFTLYQSQKIKKLLHRRRIRKLFLHLPVIYIGKVGTIYLRQKLFFITVQITDKIRQTQGKTVPFVSRRKCLLRLDKPLSCKFSLGVDFILRCRYLFQIVRIMVFLFWV